MDTVILIRTNPRASWISNTRRLTRSHKFGTYRSLFCITFVIKQGGPFRGSVFFCMAFMSLRVGVFHIFLYAPVVRMSRVLCFISPTWIGANTAVLCLPFLGHQPVNAVDKTQCLSSRFGGSPTNHLWSTCLSVQKTRPGWLQIITFVTCIKLGSGMLGLVAV